MYCRNCGKEVAEQAAFCVACGVAPRSGAKFCSNCGGETDAVSQFCIKCGAQLTPAAMQAAPADPTVKSKMVAGVLAIVLGCFGIHRFYLGYNNIGIIQAVMGAVGLVLLPFTCGISGILLLGAAVWGLIDGIMIFTGSINRDAAGKPLKD